MQTFCITGDDKHLYFKNMECRSAREELAEIMLILEHNNTQVSDPILGPDCTLYPCRLKGHSFTVCNASMDGDGSFLCVEDETTAAFLEKIFTNHVIIP